MASQGGSGTVRLLVLDFGVPVIHSRLRRDLVRYKRTDPRVLPSGPVVNTRSRTSSPPPFDSRRRPSCCGQATGYSPVTPVLKARTLGESGADSLQRAVGEPRLVSFLISRDLRQPSLPAPPMYNRRSRCLVSCLTDTQLAALTAAGVDVDAVDPDVPH